MSKLNADIKKYLRKKEVIVENPNKITLPEIAPKSKVFDVLDKFRRKKK